MATKEQIDNSRRYEVYIGNLYEWKQANSLELAITLVGEYTPVSETSMRDKVLANGLATISQDTVRRSRVLGPDMYIILDTKWVPTIN